MSIRDLGIPTPKALQDCYFNNVYIGSTGSTGAFSVTDKIKVNSLDGVSSGYIQDTSTGQFKFQSSGPVGSICLNPDSQNVFIGQTGAASNYKLNVSGDIGSNGIIHCGLGGGVGKLWFGNNGATGYGIYNRDATNNVAVEAKNGKIVFDTIGDENTNCYIDQVFGNGSKPLYMKNPLANTGCYAETADPNNRMIIGVGGINVNGLPNTAVVGSFTNTDVIHYRNSVETMRSNSLNDLQVANGVQVGNTVSVVPGTVKYTGGALNVINNGGLAYPLTNPLNVNNVTGTLLRCALQTIRVQRVAGVMTPVINTLTFGFSAATIPSQTPLMIDCDLPGFTTFWHNNFVCKFVSAAGSPNLTINLTGNTNIFVSPFRISVMSGLTGLPLGVADFADGDYFDVEVLILGN